jgi:hypothetical protein
MYIRLNSPAEVTRMPPLIGLAGKASFTSGTNGQGTAAGPARRERSNSPLPDPPRQPDWCSTAGAWGGSFCSAIVPSSRTCSPRNACCTPSGREARIIRPRDGRVAVLLRPEAVPAPRGAVEGLGGVVVALGRGGPMYRTLYSVLGGAAALSAATWGGEALPLGLGAGGGGGGPGRVGGVGAVDEAEVWWS